MSNIELLGLDTLRVWDTERAFLHLSAAGQANTKRTAERRLHELAILPPELKPGCLEDELGRKPVPVVLNWEIEQARSKNKLVLFLQLFPLPTGNECLHANDARGGRYWVPLEGAAAGEKQIATALLALQLHIGKDIAVFPHGRLASLCHRLPAPARVSSSWLSYPPRLDLEFRHRQPDAVHRSASHLKQLEAESIHIIREIVAEAANPVMLYSAGKNSSVMLHLAHKACYPAAPPFPLLHVDTRWKFQEMYLFRDRVARESGIHLLVHTNPEAIAKDINPFDHGPALHAEITETEGLKQALEKYDFDVVLSGARRDHEQSRTNERIFSIGAYAGRWDPADRRPQLWNLYNVRKKEGKSVRVFPLSNWTELDIWQYIHQENIPVVPLYFAKKRPVVVRDGVILSIDDARMRLLPGEKIRAKNIRFRTLGCYPLTSAIESNATNPAEIVLELANARGPMRQGRAVDAGACV